MKEYRFGFSIRAGLPDEAKQHYYQNYRSDIAVKLLDVLEQTRLPATIDFEEGVEKRSSPVYPFDEEVYQYDFIVTPVEHQRVTFAKYDHPVYTKLPSKLTLKQRIRILLRGTS